MDFDKISRSIIRFGLFLKKERELGRDVRYRPIFDNSLDELVSLSARGVPGTLTGSVRDNTVIF